MAISSIIPLLAAFATFDFSSGLDSWRTNNYENRTHFEIRDCEGVRALTLSRDPKATGGGTAWELDTPEFAVKSGEKLAVFVKARGTVRGMNAPNGFKGNYMTALRWFGADGHELKGRHTGFGFELHPERWHTSVFTTTVPEGAVKVRAGLGADTPNLEPKDSIAIASVTLSSSVPSDSGSQVTLRDDGTVLVNGKPFFPIGIYGVITNDFNSYDFNLAMRQLKEAGFNTVQRHGLKPEADFDAFMKAVETNDMKTFTMPVWNYSRDLVSEGVVNRLKRSPAILAWYLADDTSSYAWAEEVDNRREICRALDPERPTLQADAVMLDDNFDRYARYVHSSDIFLPELYPCHDKTVKGTEVASVVRDMELIRADIADAGHPVKSIWPIIQHFDGWGWERFPSFEELRAMSWAAIVHGGRGIIWYTYASKNPKNRGVTADPRFWDEITRVSREIAAVQDSLLERDAAEQPMIEIIEGRGTDGFGNPSVTGLLKSGAKRLYILVNAVPEAVRIRVTFDNKSEELSLPPYGVRLISSAAR